MSQATSQRPRWLRYLPARLRVRLQHRPNLLKALSNTGWLFSDRILRMGVGLFVGVWVARYLGPEQFGLLNFAMAFVSLFGAIATLGLNGVVVRDLVRHPDAANTTLGTTFLLQLVGGGLAFGLSLLAISFSRPDDTLAKIMVSVLGVVMVFKATEVVKYWFESQVESKYSVWVENIAFLVIAGVKVVFILSQAPLVAFVWAAFAEGALVATALVGVYVWRGGNLREWHGKVQRARTLLNDSWPLILSGLAVMVYMRIDQIMLGQMLGDEAVGVYSAAVKISEVWYFIPIAIAASVFPSVIEAREKNEILYYSRLQRLYDTMVLVALAVAVPVTFASDWIVDVLFGGGYSAAASVLSINIWGGLIVSLSAVHGKWLLAEGLQRYALIYTTVGMSVNVILNMNFIPKYGIEGAAVATLCAQFTPVIIQLLIPKARRNFVCILYALSAPYRLLIGRSI